jgi:hypothetical protein
MSAHFFLASRFDGIRLAREGAKGFSDANGCLCRRANSAQAGTALQGSR